MLQKLYVPIGSLAYKITSRVSTKVQNCIIGSIVFLISLVTLLFNCMTRLGLTIHFDYKELFLVNGLLTVLLIVFSVNSELECLKWKKSFLYPWLISGVIMMLPYPDMGNRATMIAFGGMMVFVFPALYFVWNNRGDYETLYYISAIAVEISTMLFYFLSILLEPAYKGAAYAGIATNTNTVGIASVAGAIATLYLCVVGKKRWIHMIAFGTTVAFSWLSASRASLLAISVMLVTYLVVVILDKESKGGKVKETFVLIVVCFVTMVTTQFILTKITPMYASKPEIEKSVSTVEEQAVLSNGLNMSDKINRNLDVNTLSSGRITIWTFYLKNLKILGHSRQNGDPVISNNNGDTAAAHNTYLEISYRSGIIAGLCYAIVALLSAFEAIKILVNKDGVNKKMLFAVFAVFAFGIMSHLERAIFPVEKMHIMMYYFAIAAFFEQAEKKEN